MDAEAALIGRTIAGRYRIERCIGRGGMAAVFAATQDGEPYEIAVKVMKRDLMKDATVVKRFRREAKAAAMLNHPNTVKVLDYGVDGEDAYIAMELAKGKDLFQALAEERPMPQTRAALIVAQVGAALAAAHAQGIVHRDLKPENVMLVPSRDLPGGELVKVLDFGIAKILQAPSPEGDANAAQPHERSETSTNLTRVGTVVGTPAYMSPEQCRGGELDGRSDVYSAGVLLYQLVTGQLPFLGETPLHTAMRHIHAPPRPPSEIRPGLHKGLERVVLKALSKWPAERQQSAEQLREELTALLGSLPDREQFLGSRSGRIDPRREPEDEASTGRAELRTGRAEPRTERQGSHDNPGTLTRQPTEQQHGMRLGGGLGKLGSPTESGSSPPPPPSPQSPPVELEDELSRSETPLAEPQPTRPRSAPPQAQASQGARRWGDDDEERTRLRPAGNDPAMEAKIAAILAKPPATDVDDDDGPRTALMATPDDGRGKSRRANRTLLMDPSAAENVTAETATPPPEPRAGEPAGIRHTVRLGSPSPTARADLPPNANKDVPAAYARTQNASNAAILKAIEEEALALSLEAKARDAQARDAQARDAQAQVVAGPGGPDFMKVSATVRVADEASNASSNASHVPQMLGAASQGILAPPLAPPPQAPRAPMPSMASDLVLAIPPQPRRGFIESLPGTTVLVVGVALGVVVSAIVAVLVVILARGS